jgi:hypothetical protein
MMKWLFSTLLIANLGMFIWLVPQHKGGDEVSSRPDDVGRLLLVGERKEQASDLNDTTERETAVASVEEPPSQEPQAEEAPVPGQAPPLVAVSEQAEQAAPPQPGREEIPPPSAPICGTLGIFNKRSQAELLSVRLLANGVKTDISSESSNKQAGFWVLIPPQKDRASAIRVAKELEAAGVADLWRFTSGSLAHAISLGLFRDQERAKARRDKIADMGFNTEVRPRHREQIDYWLNYRYTGTSPLSELQWQELSEENPKLERSEVPCP